MSWNWIPCSVSGCVVRIILVPFVFHHDHDDWLLHLSARIGVLDLHRAPPLRKLLVASLPGSLLLMKLLLSVLCTLVEATSLLLLAIPRKGECE